MSTEVDTRTQIMDAFSDQLAATGYPGISLVGVARTAGIAKPSIYHHFPEGKEALYSAVAIRYIDNLHNKLPLTGANEVPIEARLVALATASSEHGGAAISFEQRIYDALDHVNPATKDRVSGLYVSAILDPVVSLFAHAVDKGEIVGDPQFLMNAFLHLVRATDIATEPDSAKKLVALFLNGARPPQYPRADEGNSPYQPTVD